MPNHVLPCAAALLFLVRIIEFRIRGASARVPVVAPMSFAAMLTAGTLIVGCSFTEYFVRQLRPSALLIAAGLILVALGFTLRAIAARHLDEHWSVHIEIRPNHRLVQSGPYAWIRHPIYLSLLIELLGGVLLLGATYSLAGYFIVYLPVVWWRLRVEERVLVSHFGDEYARYMRRVPSMIPLPWKHA